MTSLAARLLAGRVLHMPSEVTHARRGAISHAFRYRVDYLLFAPETMAPPGLMSRNRFNLMAYFDSDHGGARGAGQGAVWAWARLAEAGFAPAPGRVLALLTQPRFLGYWFSPVSFWLLIEGNQTLAAIAEVNNTFGQRHSYMCALPGKAPLTAGDEIAAEKLFHVSPFQDVSGRYLFRFAVQPDRIAIRIGQFDGAEGLRAAMTGPLRPLTNRALIASALRRPGGALRVVALIYWHALRLKLKGAAYRPLPTPPDQEIS